MRRRVIKRGLGRRRIYRSADRRSELEQIIIDLVRRNMDEWADELASIVEVEDFDWALYDMEKSLEEDEQGNLYAWVPMWTGDGLSEFSTYDDSFYTYVEEGLKEIGIDIREYGLKDEYDLYELIDESVEILNLKSRFFGLVADKVNDLYEQALEEEGYEVERYPSKRKFYIEKKR